MPRRAATGLAGTGLAVVIAVTAACGGVRAGAGGAARGCAIVALKPIKVGSQPAAMAITPDGEKGYVANANSPFVTPIRMATNAALAPVRVSSPGGGVEAIVASPDGKTVYAATESTSGSGRSVGRVVPIRIATDRPLRPIRAGHFPIGITIRPDGTMIYVLDWNPGGGPGAVIPIRTMSNTALRPVKGGRVDAEDAIVITPDGRTLYVTNFDANTVTRSALVITGR